MSAQSRDQINYIRNSVKATVDAYDGTVNLYAWDETDPIALAWERRSPTPCKPKTEMPEELLQHVRYPEDMFKVQRELFAPLPRHRRRGVLLRPGLLGGPRTTRPEESRQAQPPYYLTLQMPGTAVAVVLA